MKSLACACLAALLATSALARPLTPAERRYQGYLQPQYTGDLPSCGDPDVLIRFRDNFHERETEYWHSGLEIVSYDKVTEIGDRANGLDYIPRRYCTARVFLSNQTYRDASYVIKESLGIIGISYGLDLCITGLDRDLAYAPNCKEARP